MAVVLIKTGPWNRIEPGETVYFKETGKPVTVKAKVAEIIQKDNLTPDIVKRLLEQYGGEIGIEQNVIPYFIKTFRDTKYCILIYLKDPEKVEPFDIDKTGFGNASAWITVKSVEELSLKKGRRG